VCNTQIKAATHAVDGAYSGLSWAATTQRSAATTQRAAATTMDSTHSGQSCGSSSHDNMSQPTLQHPATHYSPLHRNAPRSLYSDSTEFSELHQSIHRLGPPAGKGGGGGGQQNKTNEEDQTGEQLYGGREGRRIPLPRVW